MTTSSHIGIHDHMDGEAHCIECRGPCRQTGADLALSRIVRIWAVHRNRFGAGQALDLGNVLISIGVDPNDINRCIAGDLQTDPDLGPRITRSEATS